MLFFEICEKHKKEKIVILYNKTNINFSEIGEKTAEKVKKCFKIGIF